MIYTERTKRAMTIVLRAHLCQYDIGGYPYIFHPIHLAEQMNSESTCIVALLHDVLEDCPEYTMEYLAKTVPLMETEQEALRLITHDKAVPYPVYCEALSHNEIARKVKIADLKHNGDLTRVDGVKPPKYDIMQECLEMLEKLD